MVEAAAKQQQKEEEEEEEHYSLKPPSDLQEIPACLIEVVSDSRNLPLVKKDCKNGSCSTLYTIIQ